MSAFDQDDLEDYDSLEEFNEDLLNDEDYDQLYASLPAVKEALNNYNNTIPEYDVKESLYSNYYNLDESVKDLKSRFPKKKTSGTYNSILISF